MPNASTFIMFAHRGASLSLTEITAAASSLAIVHIKGRHRSGGNPEMGKEWRPSDQKGKGWSTLEYFCISSEGLELSPWVQGTLQGQVAPKSICGHGCGAS